MPHDIQNAHTLMPESVARTIPQLYATENETDPVAKVKWFTPDSSWTWYVTEYDPKERLCFGLVDGLERELGYFSLTEIENARGPCGLRVERDLYFSPKPLSELKQKRDRGQSKDNINSNAMLHGPHPFEPSHGQQETGRQPVGVRADSHEFHRAVEQVVEYLHDERSTHYHSTTEDGQNAADHIYHSVSVLEQWLARREISESLGGQYRDVFKDDPAPEIER